MKFAHQSSKLLALLYVVIFFGAATLPPGFAQETDPSKAQRPRQVLPKDDQEPDEVLKVDTDLVSLDVFATDAEGRPVRNLKQGDFKIFLDNVEQPLAFFQVERRSGEPRPLAAGIGLCSSGRQSCAAIGR